MLAFQSLHDFWHVPFYKSEELLFTLLYKLETEVDTELVIFPNNRGRQCFFFSHCIMFFDMVQVFLATSDSHKKWDQYLIWAF